MNIDRTSRRLVIIGCICAALGVAGGAFGAHMLKGLLEPPMLAAYETATRYQMYHAFGMILIGVAMRLFDNRRLAVAGWLFAVGILLFSGSLYCISLAGFKWLGPITPIGGLAFILGWSVFAWRVWRGTQEQSAG